MNERKLPQVDERLRRGFQLEAPKINAWLRERGMADAIEDFYNNPALCPHCVPQLLELLDFTYSLETRRIIATAIKHRNPNDSQKRRVFEVFLNMIKQRIGEYDVLLSTVVLNDLAQFVTADRVHEVGEMTLDPRYGQLRLEMTFVLRQIGGADAISYLLRAAKDPVTAVLALDGLAHLGVKEALPLCEEALANPDVPKSYRSAIKRTYSKLKRQAAKRPSGPSHVTTEAIPEGLAEWSANLDSENLPKMLRTIQKCVESGFGKAEISEITSMADGLSLDQTARLKFAVTYMGKENELWLEIFCDDENSLDLCVFSSAELIDRIERELDKVIE